MRLSANGIIFGLIIFAVMFSSASFAQDGGYDVTSDLWLKAILQVPGYPVTLVWNEVGSDTTPSGDRVVSGYFYADPDDFAYGSQYNPELFVKIYIATNGWCNIAFNHVTVDDVSVYSAHNYSGSADQTGTASLTGRLVEHQYDGIGGGGQSLTITGESGNQVSLNGTWKSGCIADIEDGESETTVITISGSTFSQIMNSWVNSTSCSGSSDLTFTVTGSFVLGNEITATMNSSNVTATETDILFNSFEGTINNSDLASYLNADNACGFSDWMANTPKDLLGSECGTELNSKDVIYVDDTVEPDILYFGDGDEGAPVDVNGYPTNIDRDAQMERM